MNGENESDILAQTQEEDQLGQESLPELSQELEEPSSDAPLEDNLSTEEFLQEELQNTEAMMGEIPAEVPSAVAQEVPTVSLQIEMQKAAQKDQLKQLLESWKIQLEPSYPRMVIPRLQEAEALQLMQWLLTAGFSVKAGMQWPQVEAVFSEHSDAPTQQSDGAPAVTLPENSNGVLLLSAEHLPQFSQMNTVALVSAHKSLSRRFFKEEDLQIELDRELKKMQRSSSSQYASSSFAKVLRELCGELQRQALTLGANSVIGIRLECHTEEEHRDPSLDQLRLIAIGTASIVEK